MEFRLYIGAFLTVEEAMQRAELFHENPSKYPPKIYFETKLAKGNGAEVKKALDPEVPEGVVVVQRDAITDLAGNRKPGEWVKKIGYTEDV